MKTTTTFQHQTVRGFRFGSNPFGKPSLFSHVYFLDGLLLDTGHSNMQKTILSNLQQLPVEQIFLTHHHEDHTGNLAPLQQHFQCPTYASSLCREIMKNPPSISFAQWLFWGKSTANFDIIAKEDSIATSHYNLKIIPIPGHAVDMVALYEEQQGWLFSADLYVHHYIRYFMRSERMKQQIHSLKKVLQLDFQVLFCSHNPQFKDGKEKVRKKLQFLETFYGQVAELYHKGHSATSILREMQLKEKWFIRLSSTGALSTLNMIKSVIREEETKV